MYKEKYVKNYKKGDLPTKEVQSDMACDQQP